MALWKNQYDIESDWPSQWSVLCAVMPQIKWVQRWRLSAAVTESCLCSYLPPCHEDIQPVCALNLPSSPPPPSHSMPAVLLDNLSAFSPQSSLCCFSIFSRRPSRESIFILIWVSSRLMVCSWSVFTAEAQRQEGFFFSDQVTFTLFLLLNTWTARRNLLMLS